MKEKMQLNSMFSDFTKAINQLLADVWEKLVSRTHKLFQFLVYIMIWVLKVYMWGKSRFYDGLYGKQCNN